jgi:hypothetical protein
MLRFNFLKFNFLNKKGTVISFILIGLIFAFGIFMALSDSFDLSLDTDFPVKGQWQSDFLEEYSSQRDEILLSNDLILTLVLEDSTIDLAKKGGYFNLSDSSSCGAYSGAALWNLGGSFCFPSYKSEFLKEAASGILELNRSGFDHIEYNMFFSGEEIVFLASDKIEILPRYFEESSFSEEELQCLGEKGKVPTVFEYNGELVYNSCKECSNFDSCSNYASSEYCDLDPCSLDCVSFYSENEYASCGVCPEEVSCDKYVNQYYCDYDPCNYGCEWDVSYCEESLSDKGEFARNGLEVLDRVEVVQNADVLSSFTNYFVYPHFSYSSDYKFEEYDALFDASKQLLLSCSGVTPLQPCLDSKVGERWNYGSCLESSFSFVNGKVEFCVESLYERDVEYNFALDFSGSSGVISGLSALYDSSLNSNSGGYEISFEASSSIESYVLYFTDYENLGFSGKWQVFSELQSTSSTSNVFERILIEKVNSCPAENSMEIGKGYVCGDEIKSVYFESSLDYAGGDYYVAVTSVYSGEESEINGIVAVSS